MNFIKDMIKETGNEYAGLVEDGIQFSDVTGYIDTGVYILNAMLSGSMYGGIPNNKITALAGETSCGKTFACLSMLKTYFDTNKDVVCLYFDSEGAVTSQMFIERGIDPKRVAVIGVATVEEFRFQIIKILDKYLAIPENERKPMILILDSLGMLSTSKEMTDTAEGKDTRDMTRAQVIKATFRVISLKLSKARIPMIMTNHTYAKVGSYIPEQEMSGGGGLKFAASTIVTLSKRKEKIDNIIVGNIIHCKLYKARFTKENSMVDVLLRYDTGMNKYYGLLPIAEKYGIFKKVSTRYEMPDGSKAFEKNILEDPEKYYTPDIMKKLEEAVAKEFKYGSAQDNG